MLGVSFCHSVNKGHIEGLFALLSEPFIISFNVHYFMICL